jgi:hypothetical protein
MNSPRPYLVLAVAALAWLGLTPGSLSAQDQEASQADLAKQIQNPLASVVTLPFQYNQNRGVGENERNLVNLNFQPVIPFPGEKWNIISRNIIPYVSIPIGETGAESGFGDWTTTLFWSPAKASSFVWGAGPVLQLPTASNPEVLGTGKLSLGPSVVGFLGAGNFTLGAVVWQLWSVAGESDREAVSSMTAQWFVNYNFGGGWVLGTAPIITCNWKADSGEQCTIPWGAQLSKVLMFGSRPVNFLGGYYVNSEHPTDGAQSQIRFQINLLYPQAPK